jgi:hypothetical protein
MTGGMSGGHFVGFYLAIVGLCGIIYASTRPSVVRRLGSKRWPAVASGVLACVLLAVLGSGTREIYFQTALGPNDAVVSRIGQAHVDGALSEILRPEFVQYMVRLDEAPPVSGSEKIANALTVRVGTTVDLFEQGYSFDVPPKVGQTWLLVAYKDRENALLSVFRGDLAAQRMAVVVRIVNRVLPQATTIVALREAKTDDEKKAILRENPFVMPYAAEWLSVELEKIAKEASPEIAREIEQKRAYVQKYVDNPEARHLAAGIRVQAP